MGTLGDQLRKAGLADQKRQRQVRHQESARRKKLGPREIEAEKRAREEERQRQAETRRLADRRREEERRQQHDAALPGQRLPALIRQGQVRGAPTGNRRFYFVTPQQTVSFLEVPPVIARSLAAGGHAIIDAAGVLRDDFCVVDADTARALRGLAPERVIIWNGAGS